MKVTSIGKSFTPAIIALTAMAGVSNTALAAREDNTYNDKKVTIENPDAKKKFSIKDVLIWTGLGILGGSAGSLGVFAIKKKFDNNKLTVFDYYDEEFTADSEAIDKYMHGIMVEALGMRPYYVDMEDFIEQTHYFVTKYPSRKNDLFMSIRPLSDLRLSDAQADILCRHLVLKATCTADEWENMNILPFLSDTDDYDKLVAEFVSATADDETESAETKQNDIEQPLPSQDIIYKTVERAKNTAKKTSNVEHNLTFNDVGGQKEVIYELKKGILWPIKYPKAFENNSMKHGFVLYGAPGTGKSLIAEALANEADANFIKLNGTELASKWVGESESNWRKVFGYAVSNQPSIIFIDEVDGLAGKRGNGDVYGDKVVNQILGLLSGVEKNNDQVYLIVTTNRLDKIDEAFLRSGRIGMHLELKPPQNEEEVEQILDIHLRKRPVDDKLDKKAIAKELLRLKATGADIAFIVNEAYECAMERMEIYEKMDKGDFQGYELDYLDITDIDFQKAIDEFKSSHSQKIRIGFKK